MKDTQILSAFQELDSQPPASRAPQLLVFDACQMGVVLRAVLFVEAAVGVVAMFGSVSFTDWVVRASLATGGALPATLTWLLVACFAKRLLHLLRKRLNLLRLEVRHLRRRRAACAKSLGKRGDAEEQSTGNRNSHPF